MIYVIQSFINRSVAVRDLRLLQTCELLLLVGCPASFIRLLIGLALARVRRQRRTDRNQTGGSDAMHVSLD